MAAGETELVVVAVLLDALDVVRLELLEGSLDVGHATFDTHLLGRDVGVQAGAVPVAGDGLGVPRDLGAKVLRNTGEEEAGDPEVVTHVDALDGANLELPLGGHDLGVGARDADASVETGLVVGLDDVALDDLAGAYTAVVGALAGGLLAEVLCLR